MAGTLTSKAELRASTGNIFQLLDLCYFYSFFCFYFCTLLCPLQFTPFLYFLLLNHLFSFCFATKTCHFFLSGFFQHLSACYYLFLCVSFYILLSPLYSFFPPSFRPLFLPFFQVLPTCRVHLLHILILPLLPVYLPLPAPSPGPNSATPVNHPQPQTFSTLIKLKTSCPRRNKSVLSFHHVSYVPIRHGSSVTIVALR